MDDEYTRALKEAEQEAKRAAKQKLRMEEIEAAAAEKRKQARLLGDKVAAEKEAKRAKAMAKFTTTTLTQPCVWPSMDKCLDHYETCKLKNVWVSYPPGNPRWVVPECYPVPPHPQNSSLSCPMCVAKFWASCYQEAALDE